MREKDAETRVEYSEISAWGTIFKSKRAWCEKGKIRGSESLNPPKKEKENGLGHLDWQDGICNWASKKSKKRYSSKNKNVNRESGKLNYMLKEKREDKAKPNHTVPAVKGGGRRDKKKKKGVRAHMRSLVFEDGEVHRYQTQKERLSSYHAEKKPYPEPGEKPKGEKEKSH